MSKTACVVPWSTLAIGPDGRATFCCDVPEPLTVDGRMGSVYRDSLDDLWNAREIVQVRAAMARGERPPTCHLCWEREAAGGAGGAPPPPPLGGGGGGGGGRARVVNKRGVPREGGGRPPGGAVPRGGP